MGLSGSEGAARPCGCEEHGRVGGRVASVQRLPILYLTVLLPLGMRLLPNLCCCK